MSEPFRTIVSREVGEATTVIIEGTIADADDEALASLTTLTLTLYEKKTGSILNNRNGGSILNENGGTFAAGVVTLRLSPADNALLSQVVKHETHVALIRWTYNGGVDAGWAEIEFVIHNQAKIA